VEKRWKRNEKEIENRKVTGQNEKNEKKRNQTNFGKL